MAKRTHRLSRRIIGAKMSSKSRPSRCENPRATASWNLFKVEMFVPLLIMTSRIHSWGSNVDRVIECSFQPCWKPLRSASLMASLLGIFPAGGRRGEPECPSDNIQRTRIFKWTMYWIVDSKLVINKIIFCIATYVS